jgi:alkaline phosphatase
MLQLFSGIRRKALSVLLGILYIVIFSISSIVTPTANAAGNGVNVILMIGDGMGWEAARAAAIAKGAPLYKSGKGSGLNMQTLTGYTYATTYGTAIAAPNATTGVTSVGTGNSALTGSNPVTGKSPVRPGFTFNPALNPGSNARNPQGTAAAPCQNGAGTAAGAGNIVGYEVQKGGPNPWTPISVPVYYQGDKFNLAKYIGQSVAYVDNPPGGTKKTYQIPGVPTAIDQSHIYKAMLEALTS